MDKEKLEMLKEYFTMLYGIMDRKSKYEIGVSHFIGYDLAVIHMKQEMDYIISDLAEIVENV